MPDTDDPITLHMDLAESQLEALERALLRARSAELTEVRRRNVRLTAGYGDATGRDVMDDEARAAQARFDALGAVLDAVRAARTSRS